MSFLRKAAIGVMLVALWAISTAIAQIIINPPVSDVHINGKIYTNSQLQANPAGWIGGIANDIGEVTALYPQGRFSPRIKLSGNLDMYVDPVSGNDFNNCLVGNPCQTVQHPFDVLREHYDMAGYAVTVHLADGTYFPGLQLREQLLGQVGSTGNLVLEGNESSPQNVVITDWRYPNESLDSGIGVPIFVGYGGVLSVRGVTLVSGFRSAWAYLNGTLFLQKIRFGTANQAHIVASTAAQVRVDGNYEIYGGTGACHVWAANGGVIYLYNPAAPATSIAITITNSPDLSVFACADMLSQVHIPSGPVGIFGAVTGTTKYVVRTNSIINTNGSGTSFLPGAGAGIATTGGAYY